MKKISTTMLFDWTTAGIVLIQIVMNLFVGSIPIYRATMKALIAWITPRLEN